MSWRVAKSLLALRDQVNARFPGRSKSDDGTIGDAAHAARSSDHNPDSEGVVRAMDLTHDPASGFDSYKFADYLREHWDSRVKYIISNRRIAAKGVANASWRPYTGSNPHDRHVHISVVADDSLADSTGPWDINFLKDQPEPKPQPKPQPEPVVRPPIATDVRLKMAKQIVDFEARRDSAGHLEVYRLPANDGGGTYEVAGINDRYNRDEVLHLVELLHSAKYQEAETYAENFILQDTHVAAEWTSDPGVEYYLRDCVFNRGAAGAAKIMQLELGFSGDLVDGDVGPLTKARIAVAEKDPRQRLVGLRFAREHYERNYVGYRANFWRGLVNRWDGALKFAQSLQVHPSGVPVA